MKIELRLIRNPEMYIEKVEVAACTPVELVAVNVWGARNMFEVGLKSRTELGLP